MKRSGGWIAAAAIVSAATGFALPAHSQRLGQAVQWCDHESGDLRIRGCTAIIEARRIPSTNRASAYSNRGNGWIEKGDYDRALADYAESIRIDPQNPIPYYNRGNTWYRKKEYDRAIADYDHAIKLNNAEHNYYNNRGVVYFNKGDYNHAIVDYNEAIRLRPTDAGAYANRGNAWFEKRDYDQAVADYSAALRLDPGHVRAYQGRARAQTRNQNYGAAVPDYDELVKLEPQNELWWRERCLARAVMGLLDPAVGDCNEALRLMPNDANALQNRGLVYHKRGQFDNALADYERALKIDPSLVGALYGRGIVRRQSGDADGGTLDIAAAIKRRPDIVREFTGYGFPATTIERPATNVTVAPSSSPLPPALPDASSDRRVALVIGNSGYTKAPVLPNPRRDAEAVASALRRVGFQVVTLEADLTRDHFIDALRRFASKAEGSDWALVYFAGHGIEMDGVNYLIPVDASLATDRDVTFEAVPLGQILTAVDGAKKLRLVVLDACRNNPFLNQMRRTVASRSIGQGLGRVEPEAGTLVVYAAKHGEVALDGDQRNSPFVEALTNRILSPGIEVRRLFDLVRDDVIAATNRKQQPFSYGSVSGSEDFYFVSR